MRKWFVHDEAGCYESFATVEAAAKLAKELAEDDPASDVTGVHIVYMSKAQHEVYCKTASLGKAIRSKE